MTLNKSNLLIRDYENIRQILRDIYIYGCFSRDDFIRKGVSGRKYDNEQRRINAYLPEKFIQKRRVNKRVLLYCTYRAEDNGKNYLADTYRNKSFTMLDIMSYFFVLQILGRGKDLTLQEILDLIPNYNDEVIFTKDNLRNKLEELIENGLIVSEKNRKSVLYKLSDDIWTNFETDELKDIFLFLDFMKNTSPIEMPFYFLQNKLELYLHNVRKCEVRSDEIFRFKHNHLFNLLDNEILYELLVAIHDEVEVSLTRKSINGEVEIITIPLGIVHESTYGRQYLHCYSRETKRESVVRLDKITSIAQLNKVSSTEQEKIASLKKLSDECWCVSGIEEELRRVRIEFEFDEEKETFVLLRLNREGQTGKVKRISQNKYLYEIDVRDPGEMIPWIRSFGERARVLESGDSKIEERIAADWEKAVRKYESLS